ncbi:Uncharacterised protein [Mycobacteroides abscessus subsp. abscessus]|nr:Uncharacterised protein [Mycobacteroides abscessus subsp. abscessus]
MSSGRSYIQRINPISSTAPSAPPTRNPITRATISDTPASEITFCTT